jgi:hypothetical protein
VLKNSSYTCNLHIIIKTALLWVRVSCKKRKTVLYSESFGLKKPPTFAKDLKPNSIWTGSRQVKFTVYESRCDPKTSLTSFLHNYKALFSRKNASIYCQPVVVVKKIPSYDSTRPFLQEQVSKVVCARVSLPQLHFKLHIKIVAGHHYLFFKYFLCISSVKMLRQVMNTRSMNTKGITQKNKMRVKKP